MSDREFTNCDAPAALAPAPSERRSMSHPVPDYERIVKLQLVGGSYIVTIPKQAMAKMNWLPGDHLHIASFGNRVEIEPAADHFVRLGVRQERNREPVVEPAEETL